jgi:hypothetical protein
MSLKASFAVTLYDEEKLEIWIRMIQREMQYSVIIKQMSTEFMNFVTDNLANDWDSIELNESAECRTGALLRWRNLLPLTSIPELTRMSTVRRDKEQNYSLFLPSWRKHEHDLRQHEEVPGYKKNWVRTNLSRWPFASLLRTNVNQELRSLRWIVF